MSFVLSNLGASYPGWRAMPVQPIDVTWRPWWKPHLLTGRPEPCFAKLWKTKILRPEPSETKA